MEPVTKHLLVRQQETAMLDYTAVFSLGAFAAALVGFSGATGGAVEISKHLCVLFAVLAGTSLLIELLSQL
jgi:uncharacterized membrane protein YtjA (UPF0391 family)